MGLQICLQGYPTKATQHTLVPHEKCVAQYCISLNKKNQCSSRKHGFSAYIYFEFIGCTKIESTIKQFVDTEESLGFVVAQFPWK